VASALDGDIESAAELTRQALDDPDASFGRADRLELLTTLGNIMLGLDIDEARNLLQRSVDLASAERPSGAQCARVEVNRAMADLVYADRLRQTDDAADPHSLCRAAEHRLLPVYRRSSALGYFQMTSAAALLIGLAKLQTAWKQAGDWFELAAATSVRAENPENEWRARLNLAQCLLARNPEDLDLAAEHARAAAQILFDSLDFTEEPTETPRFRLVVVPLAQAVRILRQADDPLGDEVLTHLPPLHRCFTSNDATRLRADRGGWSSHEWFRRGPCDFVLY
jgi:hypothetical protein